MSSPAAAAPQTSYRVQGRDVRLPVAVRDASTAVAFYLVPAAAAQRLIGPAGLRVATVLPAAAARCSQ